MPERPRPTAPLIIEVCGGSNGYQGLVESLHHGLEEAPALTQFYSHLDFDELVAFAASSWKKKREEFFGFSRFLESSPSAYRIFSEIYSIGFPWLNKNKAISPQQEAKHNKLNPFHGRDLEERLNEVAPATVEKLVKQLQEEPLKYIFRCKYDDERNEYDDKRVVMDFHNVYPASGRIVPAYAAEISRIMSKYPQEYHFAVPKEVPSPAPTLITPTQITPPNTTGQLSLF